MSVPTREVAHNYVDLLLSPAAFTVINAIYCFHDNDLLLDCISKVKVNSVVHCAIS